MNTPGENRTGTKPTHSYTFRGMAEIRASFLTSDFMVITAVESHEDGTLRICEGSIDGIAVVWGEGLKGQIWYREDDDIARATVDLWLAHESMAKARELSRVNMEVQ